MVLLLNICVQFCMKNKVIFSSEAVMVCVTPSGDYLTSVGESGIL